jgi:hypothetical protein
MPRTLELCLEVCGSVAEAARLLEEFQEARAAGGHGTHRDPEGLLRELQQELLDLRGAARDMRDDVERGGGFGA